MAGISGSGGNDRVLECGQAVGKALNAQEAAPSGLRAVGLAGGAGRLIVGASGFSVRELSKVFEETAVH